MIWLFLMMFLPDGSNSQLLTPFSCGISPITITYQSPIHYNLDILIPMGTHRMALKFISDVAITINEPYSTGISGYKNELSTAREVFYLRINPNKKSRFNAQVLGVEGSLVPIVSVLADNLELCNAPRYTDDSDKFVGNVTTTTEKNSKASTEAPLAKSCGRRKVVHTELIVNGQASKPGDWPWHVAISRISGSSLEYICGGTLVSKTSVLTAAHCVTIRGNPVTRGSLVVAIGKHNLIGRDIELQEKEVFKIIVHPNFDARTLQNDIALLQLKSEVVFNNYVQPACLSESDNQFPSENVFGTVVGWGFNQQYILSPTLQQITIPIVSELNCLKSNPAFFVMNLNVNKFCAGFANGTAACNGDSGGGLVVFVPDTPGDTSRLAGSWHVRGIVSLAPSKSDANICDADQYTIFTDVDKYRDWVLGYLD